MVVTVGRVYMWVGQFEFAFITDQTLNITAGYHFNIEVTDRCSGINQIEKKQLSALDYSLMQFFSVAEFPTVKEKETAVEVAPTTKPGT